MNLIVIVAMTLLSFQYGPIFAITDSSGFNSENIPQVALEADRILSIHKIDIQDNLAAFSDHILTFQNHLDFSQSQIESILELVHHARDLEGERLNDENIWTGLNELVRSQDDATVVVKLIKDESDKVITNLKTLFSAMQEIVASLLHAAKSIPSPPPSPPSAPLSGGVADCRRWISRFELWKKRLNSGVGYNQLDSIISETLKDMYSKVHHLSNESIPLEVDMFSDLIETLERKPDVEEGNTMVSQDGISQVPACSCSCDAFNISFIELVVQQVVHSQLSLLLEESERFLSLSLSSSSSSSEDIGADEEAEGAALFVAAWCRNHSALSVEATAPAAIDTNTVEQCIPPEPCVCPLLQESMTVATHR